MFIKAEFKTPVEWIVGMVILGVVNLVIAVVLLYCATKIVQFAWGG